MVFHSTKRGICFPRSMRRTKEVQEEGSSGFTLQHLRSNGKAKLIKPFPCAAKQTAPV